MSADFPRESSAHRSIKQFVAATNYAAFAFIPVQRPAYVIAAGAGVVAGVDSATRVMRHPFFGTTLEYPRRILTPALLKARTGRAHTSACLARPVILESRRSTGRRLKNC